MDFNALRERALCSGAEGEAVTVNTRALIDKVLARYSSEWTVLRELVANAADACATKVTIRFTTWQPTLAEPIASNQVPSLEYAIRYSTLRRLEVANNGNAFADSDWRRLKSIAEGNPDEQKIGAFGVGFYSVFADCENPLVLSGSQGLDFYWNGNALFTRKLQLNEYSSETSFVLDYRDSTTKVPDLVGLYRFLATSLTFVNLDIIELWLDNWNLLVLTKNTEDRVVAAVPADIKATTKGGLMRITQVQRELVRISATMISPILSDFENTLAGLSTATNHQEQLAQRVSTASVCLRMLSASVSTSVTGQFAMEIERATRKPPPKNTKLAILRSSSAPTFLNEKDALGIFDSMIPSKSGRIFIGFPTHQTTSLLAHISLNSVIPTVERESIDLNARWVRDWNKEILRVAGTVARIAWNDEMRDLKEKMEQRIEPGIGRFSEVLAEATHVFKQFAFKESTPYPLVGQIIQQTFWDAGKGPINIFSSHGVLPSDRVRIAADGVAGFVDGIPILPEQIINVAEPFVMGLRANGYTPDISIEDIRKELGAKALDSGQLLELLKWVQKKAAINLEEARSVLASARASVKETGDGVEITRYITLRSVRYYVNDDLIPPELPVDLDTMPVAYTKIFSRAELHGLGWRELPLKEWTRFLISTSHFPVKYRGLFPHFDIFHSTEFAGSVLRIISRRWSYIMTEEQQAIADLLKFKVIMPTKLGMMAPTKSYLSSVTLFRDLANVIDFEGVSETVLVALGVQKMVELSMVLKRLKSSKPVSDDSPQGTAGEKWSFVDLINYLVTVSDQLTPQHIAVLQNASICHAEGNRRKWYKVCDLYEPADTLRGLGLKVLDWPATYRPGGIEDVFLRDLGLRQFPTVPDLVQIIAQAIAAHNKALADRALEYFVTSFAVNRYHTFNRSSINTTYLPLEQTEDKYSDPTHCFTSEGAALLGYPILRSDLHPHAYKFGVEADPPISWCLTRLVEHPPRSIWEAVAVFSTLECRKPSDLENLDKQVGRSKFVPIFSSPVTDGILDVQTDSNSPTVLRYVAPKDCYVGEPESFARLFDFVGFTSEGNRFLQRCGAQVKPSCWDVGYRFVQQPHKLLEMLTGLPENYKYWLQWLAEQSQQLQRDPALWQLMRASQFLLGEKPQANQGTRNATSLREAYILKSAKEVVIVDDYAAWKCFRSQLCTAPRNRILEQFYIDLGSESLSRLVEVIYNLGGEIQEPLAVMKMQNRVIERASFFLSEVDQSNIKVNAAQLKDGLTVKATPHISLRRTLRGYGVSHVDSVTAAAPQGVSSMEWTLWFTPKGCRIPDVSIAIAKVLLHRPTLNIQLSFDSLLSMEVRALEAYGYDVSRILVAQQEELLIAEDQRRKEEESRARLQAEGLLPVSTGTDRSPFGSGNSFASESSITRSLDTAIAASRAFKASYIHSAGSSQQVKEAAANTYCDVRPGRDLTLASMPSASNDSSLPLFLPRSLVHNASFFAIEHADSIRQLTAILRVCADALGMWRECLHLFFEETGVTVAFNTDGSLFFNLRAWEELGHGWKEGGGSKEAERFWFVVFCHEVAHNLILGHGPEHGFWT
ncbi:hypothetical protein FGG08_005687 [Glutinoglossum americanum]|uniref:Sacsin/Nov domain-containing protein n=1 Tax=Glutinoglossum americanum TaxID=1670608 RepID=A0A9P8HXN8_9PEZI|nr:hypothetical protein FGG08_005687 [Glutinoglossum americanum]